MANATARFERDAQATDVSGPSNEHLRRNIGTLSEMGWFAAGVSPVYGGTQIDPDIRRECAELIASACGTTAFTAQNINGGAGFVSGAQKDEIKADVLPRLASGELHCGVAFAHLRRTGPPVATAHRVRDGYTIHGKAPWITGWGLLDSFVLGAVDDSSQDHVYVYIDRHKSAAEIVASAPVEVQVMNSADTVAVEFRDLFVPDRDVLFSRPASEMRRGDYCGITGHVTLPLGCALGSVRYLRTIAKGRENVVAAADRLQQQIDLCREQSIYWSGSRADEPCYFENALNSRSTAISLAFRAAQTAIAATAGKSHLLSCPAQRRYREASFYATVAQTADIQANLIELFSSH
jgi:alkylation response protein AidB-like acyl-CoA dehydrogenase